MFQDISMVEFEDPYFLTNVSDFYLGANASWNSTIELAEGERLVNVTSEMDIAYAIPLYGYCMPFLLVVTIVANTLIVVVLSKRHMRTPTNAVLMAMALSDMFTLLFPAPWLFYMYTFGNHYKPLSPVGACYAWRAMNDIIPGLFHTASIWLTLALAVQRYIYVCHAPMARTWCTMPNVLKGVVFISICATLHQSPRFFELVYEPTTIRWGDQNNVVVCKVKLADWIEHGLTPDVYYTIYFLFRVIFVHALPCISLVALNLLLFKALRKAQIKRNKLFKENRKGDCKKLRDSNCTTLMLIVVVTVFLFTEIPLAVVTVLHIISSSIKEILDYHVANILILFTNFFIILSYPINFAIYCGMSRDERPKWSRQLQVFLGKRPEDQYKRNCSVRLSIDRTTMGLFKSKDAYHDAFTINLEVSFQHKCRIYHPKNPEISN
ncbi:hypothetical protein GE061_010102 [Apolygus lucorum]|uniref:G-protein coupled receptors family 1 profile domain-containing protein n=1 Tax=Apolygus lucorum TaxID=248454 RepID=A0A8S9Y247_APOLU|nr:hypothetical protein GE061_010102 [Apolygus lucorum]